MDSGPRFFPVTEVEQGNPLEELFQLIPARRRKSLTVGILRILAGRDQASVHFAKPLSSARRELLVQTCISSGEECARRLIRSRLRQSRYEKAADLLAEDAKRFCMSGIQAMATNGRTHEEILAMKQLKGLETFAFLSTDLPRIRLAIHDTLFEEHYYMLKTHNPDTSKISASGNASVTYNNLQAGNSSNLAIGGIARSGVSKKTLGIILAAILAAAGVAGAIKLLTNPLQDQKEASP